MKITKHLIVAALLFFSWLAMNAQSQVMKMKCKVTGQGNPLVLVPGGLTGWVSWEPFEKIFTEKRTVIRVQLLGVEFGLTDTPLPKNYSVKTESSALEATLDSLGYKMPVDVVAWSFGAFASLDFALDHPQRIRTLTLIEPPAMWVLRGKENWNSDIQAKATFFEKFHGEITEDMLDEFLQNAGFTQPGQSARSLPQWNNWLKFRRSLRINPAVVTHRDEISGLKKFQPKTLLVKGTGSAAWLHSVIDVLSKNLPHNKVVEFPGGHAPHIVSRDKFLEELNKFQER